MVFQKLANMPINVIIIMSNAVIYDQLDRVTIALLRVKVSTSSFGSLTMADRNFKYLQIMKIHAKLKCMQNRQYIFEVVNPHWPE